MPITNRDIKRASRQVFASTRAIVTPFYNRDVSKQEVEGLFTDKDTLRGSAVIVSAPMGTGKTFFIDQVAQQLGIVGRERPLLVREVTDRNLGREKGNVVFIDEGDIKTDWQSLTRGVGVIGRHLADTRRVGLVLGDLVLRNPDLLQHLPAHHFLRNFERLDSKFLQGVIQQRLEEYLDAGRGQDIIEPELYKVLVPDGTAQVNSFRSILSFLEKLVGTLPHNNAVCRLTVDIAKQYVGETFDPLFSTDRQEDFLNCFLDELAKHHPRGSGLEHGFSTEQMFILGRNVGYTAWESFQDEIIDPFGEQKLLLSGGIPALDDHGRFARWVAPYYPSLDLMLMAEQV